MQKPTQKGECQEPKQAQQGVKGDAPHMTEAFGAMRRKEEGNRAYPISRPTGGSSKDAQSTDHKASPRPGRCEYNQIPERRQQREDPTEPRSSTPMDRAGGGEGRRRLGGGLRGCFGRGLRGASRGIFGGA